MKEHHDAFKIERIPGQRYRVILSEVAMQHTVERLRAEFLEMPGLRLTVDQIRRFCGLDPANCSAALNALVEERFLCAKPDGTYARLSDGDVARRRPAKAKRTSTSTEAA